MKSDDSYDEIELIKEVTVDAPIDPEIELSKTFATDNQASKMMTAQGGTASKDHIHELELKEQ